MHAHIHAHTIISNGWSPNRVDVHRMHWSPPRQTVRRWMHPIMSFTDIMDGCIKKLFAHTLPTTPNISTSTNQTPHKCVSDSKRAHTRTLTAHAHTLTTHCIYYIRKTQRAVIAVTFVQYCLSLIDTQHKNIHFIWCRTVDRAAPCRGSSVATMGKCPRCANAAGVIACPSIHFPPLMSAHTLCINIIVDLSAPQRVCLRARGLGEEVLRPSHTHWHAHI